MIFSPLCRPLQQGCVQSLAIVVQILGARLVQLISDSRAVNRRGSRFECCLDIPTMRSHMAFVQRQSNSRGWLHRAFPCKRHQTRHLCDLVRLLAKQVLSQLSYTPTATI